MSRLCALLGSLALVALLAAPAQATPIVEQTLIATGGDVVVTFMSNGAGFTSELWLDGELGDQLGTIFNNWTTEIGATSNLGRFVAGTELVFKLLVEQTGDVFYTGAGSRNADGLVHASVDSVAGNVLVGFEDLLGGGDLDYNDLVFAFTNVTPSGSSATTGSAAGGTNTGANGGDGSGGDGAAPGGTGTTATVNADEPSSLVLLGSGLSMLVFIMKRQTLRR